MVRPLKALIVSSTKPDSFERVGVDRHLHVEIVGDGEAAIDRRRRRAPILVQLQAAGAGLDLLDQAPRACDALPLPKKPRFIGKAIGRLDHARDVPGAGRAGRRRACRWPDRCRRPASW